MTKEEIQKFIESRDFESLIGETENEWFECKGQPYRLDNDAAKRELAKDVSSFANAEGGFIFIGLSAKKSALHSGDEVETPHPFPQNLVDKTRYYDVIRAWVYPEIEGLKIKWNEMPTQPVKGLVVITIPKQRDSIRLFLITKTPINGKTQAEIFCGYAQRKGDISQPLSIVDLQRSLRSGFHYEKQLNERLNEIEILLKTAFKAGQIGSEINDYEDKIAERLEQSIEDVGLKSERIILISAYPNQSNQLKTIFLSSEGSI